MVRAELEGQAPENASFVLLTRRAAEIPHGEYRPYRPMSPTQNGPLEFCVPDSDLIGRTLEFQLEISWLRHDERVSFSERWRKATLTD